MAPHPSPRPRVLEVLRGLPLFSELSDEDLTRLAALAECLSVPAGTLLMEEGSEGDAFYVIVEGEMRITRREGDRDVLLNDLGPGRFLSEMSLLEDRPRTASARALVDSEVLSIPPRGFRQTLAKSPGATLTMLRTVTERLRSTEATLIERGRMAGLGTMAAGLAHELNNPAAALLRSTDLLEKAMTEWHRRCAELGRLGLSPTETRIVADLERRLAEGIDPPGPILGHSSMEAELERCLEDLEVREAWRIAPVLAESGWDPDWLAALAESVAAPHLEPVVQWAAAGATAFGLVNETRQAARSISSIVANVRSYSSLDRGPVQTVNVEETLANTLLILKRQLGEDIRVDQDIPSDLPPIEAHGGELGQVWTNLIQNALDSMNEGGKGGTLTLRAQPTPEGVQVEIGDDGPGIPPEVRPHIFDPFFTTKPMGTGTGLGLAISYGIVVNQHRGSIKVESVPGNTVFTVTLPSRRRPD